jgi:hypothetical protein
MKNNTFEMLEEGTKLLKEGAKLTFKPGKKPQNQDVKQLSFMVIILSMVSIIAYFESKLS